MIIIKPTYVHVILIHIIINIQKNIILINHYKNNFQTYIIYFYLTLNPLVLGFNYTITTQILKHEIDKECVVRQSINRENFNIK